MYKSSLQIFCQRKKWMLPVYSATKDGPDHRPHFFATVTVNGTSFASEVAANSAKEAQNEAARVALLQLGSADGDLDSSHGAVSGEGSQAIDEIPQASGFPAAGKPAETVRDMQHLCKTQLQIYAQKRSLPLPVYAHERDGPCHACRFKSTVAIEGKTYSSEGFFPTLKDAENSAAKAALASLLPTGSGEEEISYKNLLQELAQKKCFLLPVYVTTRAGDVHASTFVSTVEVNQQVFTGIEARTKKLAEMSAANVAYTNLKECNSSESAAGPVDVSQEQELGLPTPKVDFGKLAHLNQNFQPKLHPVAASKGQELVSSSPQVELCHLNHSNKNIPPELLVPSEKLDPTSAADSSTINPGSFSGKTIGKLPSPPLVSPSSVSNLKEKIADTDTAIAGTEPSVIHPGADRTKVVGNPPASHPPASPSFTPLVTHAGGAVASDSSIQHQNGLTPRLPSTSHMPSAMPANDGSCSGISGLIRSSIGLPNRIVIHPSNISPTYPTGSTVLPVSDTNWVAVSSPPQSTM
ncbi:unnamed protein product [Linum tenue]|uniref:DRBM domain-containing protein n=1 Tax=Linum tenue TaxID=586396 RepID=A0AAV0LG39_9ROSI|nr:unnamed protein product [Linum tenue]